MFSANQANGGTRPGADVRAFSVKRPLPHVSLSWVPHYHPGNLSKKMRNRLYWIVAVLGIAAAPACAASGYDVVEKSIADLRRDLADGKVTSEELVRAY